MSSFIKSLKKPSPFKPQEERFIQKKGLMSIGIWLVIIVLIMSLLVIYTQKKHQRELVSDAYTLTSLIANYSEGGLEGAEANNLLTIIKVMGSKSKLLYGMIMDVNRRIIAHTDFSYVDKILADPLAIRVASSNNPLQQVYTDPGTNQKVFEFSRPLYANGKKLGVVRLGFSPDKNSLFSDSGDRGLLVVAILIFTLVPISYYLVRKSLRPLLHVNKKLNYLLEKNQLKKLQLNSNGRGGRLAERFNQAIELLENKYDKLSVSYENIEISNSVLSYEKDRIESVINALGDGIIVTDCVGNIILINRKMERLMKLSRHEVIGNKLKECFDNEEILSFIERNQLYESVFAQKNLEIELKQSGEQNIVRFSSLPLLSSEEKVLGNIVISKDITVHKIAQKNQSNFIAHVSHELITPLNTIKSYIEMLMDDELNDRDTKIEFYNTINEEADRLARLINNLLNISKIEMGSLMINKDLVKSREFLEDILVSLKSLGVSKNVKLESILPDKLSSLVIDKGLLHVAILNILSNAIKYTPQGGAVTIGAEEDESHIMIDVVDTGYGISNEDLPHIFDKFFRSSHESIQGQTGSGLGLALSREIIRLHNGEIEVTSKTGQGTHFTVTLPKADNPRIKNYDKSYHSFTELNKG